MAGTGTMMAKASQKAVVVATVAVVAALERRQRVAALERRQSVAAVERRQRVAAVERRQRVAAAWQPRRPAVVLEVFPRTGER